MNFEYSKNKGILRCSSSISRQIVGGVPSSVHRQLSAHDLVPRYSFPPESFVGGAVCLGFGIVPEHPIGRLLRALHARI